jgi:cell division septation protein DedD
VPPAGESIGELWQPAEYRPSPAWRELDRRDRLLRVGRALGAVAAVATMVGLLSWLPTGSGTPSRNLRETAVRQSVESPGDQSASRTLPAELSTAKPSSATTGRARSNGRNAHGTRVRDDTDTDTDTETSSDTRSGSGTGSGSN